MDQYDYLLNELNLVEKDLKERKELILEYETLKNQAYHRGDKRTASFLGEEIRLLENSIAKDRLYYKQNRLKYKLSQLKEDNGSEIYSYDWLFRILQIIVTLFIAILFITITR